MSARHVTVGDVIARYGAQPLSTRAYLNARRATLPMSQIEREVPSSGRILEACCGYGALSILMTLREPQRVVTGIDIDPARVAAARAAGAGIARLTFEVADLRDLVAVGLDAIVLVDSLHYFRPEEQLEILKRLRHALAPGGLFVCRHAVKSLGPRYWWTWLHERAMVGLSLTQTRERSFHFHSLPAFHELMDSAGFSIERVGTPSRWLPYANHLFVARARRTNVN